MGKEDSYASSICINYRYLQKHIQECLDEGLGGVATPEVQTDIRNILNAIVSYYECCLKGLAEYSPEPNWLLVCKFANNHPKHDERVANVGNKIGGISFPISFPLAIPALDVVWCSFHDLKETRSKYKKSFYSQKEAYQHYFAQRPVCDTLKAVLDELGISV